jgi:hypothetical protein
MLDTGRTITLPRGLLVLAVLTLVGIATVLIRAETARAAHRVQRLHQQHTRLRHQLWGFELELARLRAPQRIAERATRLGLDVQPPPVDRPPSERRGGRGADRTSAARTLAGGD